MEDEKDKDKDDDGGGLDEAGEVDRCIVDEFVRPDAVGVDTWAKLSAPVEQAKAQLRKLFNHSSTNTVKDQQIKATITTLSKMPQQLKKKKVPVANWGL
jgi:hypothetical protein